METHLKFGDVNVADLVYMYKKLQFHNHQNLGFEQLRRPLTKNFDTEAAWLKLPEKWKDFCQKASSNGESFAAFFSMVNSLKVSGNQLILFLKDDFYAMWASEKENRLALENVIASYVEVPAGFRLEIRGMSRENTDREEELRKQQKMLRRYQTAEDDDNGTK